MHRNITITFISVEDNAYDDYILMQNQWWKISYVKFLSFRSKEVIWLNRWQMVKLPFNPPSNQTRTLWLFDLNKSKPPSKVIIPHDREKMGCSFWNCTYFCDICVHGMSISRAYAGSLKYPKKVIGVSRVHF